MIKITPFPHPPIYVSFHPDQKTAMHGSWLNYFEGITQQLNKTLTPTGNVIPSISDEEALQVEAISDQKVIFNEDLQAFQGNINGNWETFTTVTLLSNSEISSFVGTSEDRLQFIYDVDNDELYFVKGSVKFQLVKI